MWGQIIGSVVGGLLGGGGSEKKESTTIDPRLGYYVFGPNGRGGLLGEMDPIWRSQLAQGGLNDMQRGGMEMQRQTLMSPQFTQGYDAMRSMGLGLLGGGVARNPFNSGSMGGGYGGGGMQQQGGGMGGNPTGEIQRQFNALSTGNGGQAALDDWFRATQYSPEQINAAMPQYATADLGREMARARGPVRPTTNMNYQPFSYAQTSPLSALSQPIQTVAEYQAANPRPAPAEDAEAAIEDYLRRIGFDGYGEGGNTNAGGFDGGLLGSLGLDGGGNSVGNNGGMGLGSAMGGEGVDMGSAAGNAGDNSAEGATGGSDGVGGSGSDGSGGGFGGGSGDGYAKGGKVTKNRLRGPNPKGPDDGYAALDEGEYWS